MVDYRRQAERHFKAGGKCYTGFVSDDDYEAACRRAGDRLKEILKKELAIMKFYAKES